jgi:hypothetical protein
MGLITNLIRANSEKKLQDREQQLANWKTIATLPEDVVTPQMREWALTNLGDIAAEGLGVSGKYKGVIHGLLSTMAGLNPMPRQQPPPAAPPPQHMFLTADEARAVRERQLQEKLGAEREMAQFASDTERQLGDAERDRKIQRLDQLLKAGTLTQPEYAAYRAQVEGFKPLTLSPGTRHNVQVQLPGGIKPATVEQDTKTGKFYDLTGKEYALPQGAEIVTPGTKTGTKTPTANEIAFAAYAEKHGKPVDQLTAVDRVRAIREYREQVKTGAADTSAPALSVPPKQYVPGGQSIANPGARDMAMEGLAWAYITTGTMPYTGRTKGAADERTKAVARAGEILADLGSSYAELPAIRGQLKSNAGALSKITTMGAQMSQFEDTLAKNMEYARVLSEQFSRTASPLANRLLGGIERQTGNQAVDNFNLQMRTIAQEYAKIMAGSTSASGVRISDSEEATRMINGYVAHKNLEGLFNVIRQDIANRRLAVEAEKQTLLSGLRQPLAGFGSQPSGISASRKRQSPPPQEKDQNGKPRVRQRHRLLANGQAEYQYSTDGGKTWQPGRAPQSALLQ